MVVEGQLRLGAGNFPAMSVTRVVSVSPGRLPDPVLIEAGELTLPRFLGQRVQLKAQLQGLTPGSNQVRLTATSRAVQYEIETRGIPRALLTGFLGTRWGERHGVAGPREPNGERSGPERDRGRDTRRSRTGRAPARSAR